MYSSRNQKAPREVLPVTHGLPPFLLAVFVAVVAFLYFEVQWQLWFLRLLGGFLIRVWIPAAVLFAGAIAIWRFHFNVSATLAVMIGGYAGLGLLSILATEETLTALKYYVIMVGPLATFLAITAAFRTQRDIDRLLLALFVCGVIQATYSAYQFYSWDAAGQPLRFGDVITTNLGNEIGSAMTASFENGTGGERVARFTDFSIEQGKFAGMLFPVMLLGFYFTLVTRGRMRWLAMLAATGLLYLLVATMSRSAIAAAFVGFAVFLVYLTRYGYAPPVFVVFALSAVVGVAYFNFAAVLRIVQTFTFFDELATSGWVARMADEYGLATLDDSHLMGVSTTWSLFRSSPVLGVGYTAIQQVSPDVGSEHNRYLFILASSGLPTLMTYSATLLLVFLSVHRAVMATLRAGRDARFGVMMLALVSMVIVKLNNEGVEAYYYWIILAVAYAWSTITLGAPDKAPATQQSVPASAAASTAGRWKPRQAT